MQFCVSFSCLNDFNIFYCVVYQIIFRITRYVKDAASTQKFYYFLKKLLKVFHRCTSPETVLSLSARVILFIFVFLLDKKGLLFCLALSISIVLNKVFYLYNLLQKFLYFLYDLKLFFVRLQFIKQVVYNKDLFIIDFLMYFVIY